MKVRRRQFLLGTSALALAACAPTLAPASPKIYRIGWLSGSTQAGTAPDVEILRAVLHELGYVEGRNLILEIRYADGHTERGPALAAELVALKLDVILARGAPEALALQQATSTIPIVLVGTPDPVENGLVASLARPGGNITGAGGAGAELNQKRLQLLRDSVPGVSRVAYLFDASNPQQVRGYQEARSAAAALGIELQPVEVRTPGDFADAFAAIGRGRPDAISLGQGALLVSQRRQILDFIAASRLPSMTGGDREYVDGGALMCYLPNLVEIIRRAATYVDRILKGANAADLPIEQPSKFELIINMRTAKALGLTIPPSVLAQATELNQ